MKIKFLIAFMLLTLSAYANLDNVKIDLNPIIKGSLSQAIMLQGVVTFFELIVAIISFVLILAFDAKTRYSTFWNKYKVSRIIVLELAILMTVVLFYHSLLNLPAAIEYLFYPDVSIYKYLLKS